MIALLDSLYAVLGSEPGIWALVKGKKTKQKKHRPQKSLKGKTEQQLLNIFKRMD